MKDNLCLNRILTNLIWKEKFYKNNFKKIYEIFFLFEKTNFQRERN